MMQPNLATWRRVLDATCRPGCCNVVELELNRSTSFRTKAPRPGVQEVATTPPQPRFRRLDNFRTGDAFLRSQVTDSPSCAVHVDLHAPDTVAAATQAKSLGAEITADHGSLVVLASPAGMPFCLTADHRDSVRPLPPLWPHGQYSLVDQVCLDIAEERFEQEAEFWSAMTSWPRLRGSRPEFDYLDRPNDMPLRLLLQRVGGSGPTRAHLDLACDDVAAETARHQSIGAQVVRQTAAWTTLRDPAHREYCITSRDPWTGTIASLTSNT